MIESPYHHQDQFPDPFLYEFHRLLSLHEQAIRFSKRIISISELDNDHAADGYPPSDDPFDFGPSLPLGPKPVMSQEIKIIEDIDNEIKCFIERYFSRADSQLRSETFAKLACANVKDGATNAAGAQRAYNIGSYLEEVAFTNDFVSAVELLVNAQATYQLAPDFCLKTKLIETLTRPIHTKSGKHA